MATIFVDNTPYEVEEGQNLLRACLSLGFDIPYFCWHPALHSVGSCRQCAVKQFRDENDTRGKIVMSCMTPVTDGTRISIDDPEVKEFRASIIQWLMLNHPHDCPVCDEGGECHLQDMTVLTGHVYRKTRFKKRTYLNQDLGPFLHHEMNRCIHCYRCVRFYRDLAGGRDFSVTGIHDRVYFGRFEDGPLESEFSGNLVEICPTGVFTDATNRKHFTRKWDLQSAPSICPHCGLGCNTIASERYGTIRRIRNRYNSEVNGYFLCDRGRFGYEFVNDGKRILHPSMRLSRDAAPAPIGEDEALRQAATILRNASRTIGIGSPRASLEANFALKHLVGEENFCAGVSRADKELTDTAVKILRDGPAKSASLHDMSQADAILILGEDVTNTAPMMALQLRQASRLPFMNEVDSRGIDRWNATMVLDVVRDKKGPFFVATPYETKLDDIASETHRAAPQDIALLGFAVAHELGAEAPVPEGLDESVLTLAASIAESLKEAKRPLIVSGVSCGRTEVVEAAANIAWALVDRGIDCQIAYAFPESNSAGVTLAGGIALDDAFAALGSGEADTLVVLENDLYRRTTAEQADMALKSAKRVIVLDHLLNQTTEMADLTIPAGTFAESDGTVVNNEGRAQRFYQVHPHAAEVTSSWMWIRDLMRKLDMPESESWRDWDAILKAMAAETQWFEPAVIHTPLPSEQRVQGLRIPRQSHRYSGRTAMHANESVHEEPPPPDPDTALAFSMEGLLRMEEAPLIPRFWAPRWDSVQSLNKFQEEIGGVLKHGETGRRIIEPPQDGRRAYFDQYPEKFSPRSGELLAVAMDHIFGSEELSALSPAIALRTPEATIGVNPQDAGEMGLENRGKATLVLDGASYTVTIRFMPDLARGLSAITTFGGLAGHLRRPRWISFEPASADNEVPRFTWTK